MKKEQIMELVPELSDEQAEAIIKLWEESLLAQKQDGEALEQELADAYARGVADSEKKFADAEFERLLVSELKNAGAKNDKAIRALLDMEKISLKDGVITGLLEQLDVLKAECDYLFNEDETKPRFTSGISGSSDKIDFSKLSYKERLKLYKESPELYKSMAR